jgi:uncharacterized membrane protein YadS
LSLIVAYRQKRSGAGRLNLASIFPWFILWFLVASALRTSGAISSALQPAIHDAAEFMIIVALTAIGLSSNLRRMAATGVRPILLGLGVWIAVSVSSLLVQVVMGQI